MESFVEAFKGRFKPRNSGIDAIQLLVQEKVRPGESVLHFLDRMSVIARRGGLTNEVLIAMALKSLPRSLQERLLLQSGKRLFTWELMYEICSVLPRSGELHQEGVWRVEAPGVMPRSARWRGKGLMKKSIKDEVVWCAFIARRTWSSILLGTKESERA